MGLKIDGDLNVKSFSLQCWKGLDFILSVRRLQSYFEQGCAYVVLVLEAGWLVTSLTEM